MLHSLKSKTLVTLIAVFLLLIVVYLIFSSPAKTWRLPSSSEVIAFSPNGEMLATASGKIVTQQINPNHSIHGTSSQIEIRKVTTGKIIQTLDFFSASSIAFSPDNSLIAVGGYGGEIKIWRISDGQLVYSFKKADHYSDKTTFLSFTPDGQTLVASTGKYSGISDEPSQLSVWNLNSGNNHYILSKSFTCAAASSDGQLLAFGGPIEPLTLYRLKDVTPIRVINTNPIICRNLQFSADSKLLVFVSSLGQQKNTHIYRVEDGKLLRIITTRKPYKDKHSLNEIALSPDNQYLAASYQIDYYNHGDFFFPSIPKAFFGHIRFWNIEKGKQVATFLGHWMETNTIAFSPDGKLLASAGKDDKIRFWLMPPRNYNWLWLLGAGGLITLGYWQRAYLIRWLNW